MRWLLFVARAALICNLFFMVCIVLRYANLPLSEDLKGFIIIVGYPLSLLLNMVLHIALVVYTFQRKPVSMPTPILVFNLLCFVFQICYFLFF